MSLQKINKKAFKSPFNNPVKNSASHPQKQIPLRKHEDASQDQVMVKLFISNLNYPNMITINLAKFLCQLAICEPLKMSKILIKEDAEKSKNIQEQNLYIY
jgi:hypothetical protein